MNITILGSGGWGTALALLLHENGHAVTLWSAFAAESAHLQSKRENPYLPGIALPDAITCTADLDCVCTAEMLVLATPSFAVRKTAAALRGRIQAGIPLVIVSKGIEQESLQNFSSVVGEQLGSDTPLAVLSGPSHAEEVARGVPTACVAAAADIAVAEQVQDAFMCDHFRVYTSTDVAGVELGAALKNVIALCAGASDGLGYGDNTTAMLVTRGLHEMIALAEATGGCAETLTGLAGLGDLIVTCTSRHSRNRRAGVLIGRGVPVPSAMEQVGGVVEGYYAAAAAMKLAKEFGIEMPITEQLYQVLYEEKDPKEVLNELMTRAKKAEGAGIT